VDLADGLHKVLARVNALRYGAEPSVEWSATEEMLEAIFRTSGHLAVYGTLVPAGPNEHVLESLSGRWRDGCVHGELHETGWGAVVGFPAIRWTPGSGHVPVKLLVSDDLKHQWDRLDRFEGAEYQRILVPVHAGTTVIAVANIYEARRS
jgi:gamma-glutamylcyclotransferase (GGCT)/AIG2-like uncharacterized protein YtfP